MQPRRITLDVIDPLASGEWDAELCRLFGVPLELLPPIGPSSGELGTLRAGRR